MSRHLVASTLRTSARRMRHAPTEAELKLWQAVRAHRLMGLGFRRQMPIDRFIADFACPSHRIVVELDGAGHGEDRQIARDEARTRRLEELGWTVLRFWNDDVLRDIDGVCRHMVTVAGVE